MTPPSQKNGTKPFTRLTKKEQTEMTKEFYAFLDHHPYSPFSFLSVGALFKLYVPAVAVLMITVINRDMFSNTQTIDVPVTTDTTTEQAVTSSESSSSSVSSSSASTEVKAATAQSSAAIEKSSSSTSVSSINTNSVSSSASSKKSVSSTSVASSTEDELADIRVKKTTYSTVQIIIGPPPVADTGEKRVGSTNAPTSTSSTASSPQQIDTSLDTAPATNDGTTFNSDISVTPPSIVTAFVQSQSPTPGATNISLAPPSAKITFTSDVHVNASYIEVRLSSGELAQRFTVAEHTLSAGSPLSIPLVAPLLANTTYYIFIPPEMIDGFNGIAAMQWSFTTTAEASSSSALPIDQL